MKWELLRSVLKVAEATSVPFADSAADTASAAPIPGLAVGNKPAPGQTGPKGLAPRTNYSRVNTGSPIPADAGSSSQKSAPSDSQGFLPPKVAQQEVPMSGALTPRMTIQQMVKAAAASTNDFAAVTVEAARQLSNQGEAPVKVASAASSELESIPTSYVEKLAAAAEFVIANMQLAEEAQEAATKVATSQGPGQGATALHVTESPGGKNSFTPGGQGQATPAHVVPKTPGTHKPAEIPHGPANALDTNASSPVSGTQKVSAAMLRAAAGQKQAAAEPVPAPAVEQKEASAPAVDPRLVDYLRSMVKSAEDAINPAQISAGAAVPPQTSASGEAGGAPAGGKPQGPTGLVGSSQSAISYTKGQAKAHVKPELSKVLSEPALSSAHDNVLNKAFSHTGQAGVKLASPRALAARAVLEKMAEEACADDKKKEKKSAGMGNFTAPPVGGVAGGAM